MSALAVLIVEDEAIVAMDLQETLRELGYDAFAVAQSAEEAMAAAAARLPDLVLMDIRIHGERDGVETAALLGTRGEVPVVYLTAHSDEQTLARAKRTTPYGFLQKPVRPTELRSALEVARYKFEMERTVRERQRWFEVTLQSLGDAVLAVDLEGRVSFMNGVASALTGVSIPEALGRDIREVLRLHDVAPPLLAAVEQRAVVEHARAELTPVDGGAPLVLSLSAAPVLDDGKLLGAVMVFRDVSERERLQRQLQVSERLAALGTLAAGVAHEVNNPLGAVVANAQLVDHLLAGIDRGDAEPAALSLCREAVADVESASARIARIVSDLRAFSRPALGSGAPSDLSRCIEWATRTTRQELAPRAQLVRGTVTTTQVVGDETRVSQVLINLLANAAQAIAPGHVDENEVRIDAIDVGDRVVLSVRDSGAGMAEEVRRRVFDPFFTTKDVGVGTGLGLSICHGIVTSMGGTIEVESAVGRGTTVRVALPAVRMETPAPEPPSTRPAVPQPLRILVIDDEALVLRSVQRVLRQHRVVCCERADDALARIGAGEGFDVILCDVTMPTMTGPEFHEALSARFPALASRVVFMSGGAITARIGTFLEQQAARHLAKPFDVHSLLGAVARVAAA